MVLNRSWNLKEKVLKKVTVGFSDLFLVFFFKSPFLYKNIQLLKFASNFCVTGGTRKTRLRVAPCWSPFKSSVCFWCYGK